eukprot:Platyproteum_vivax@DN7367_c1_g1_i3.p1
MAKGSYIIIKSAKHIFGNCSNSLTGAVSCEDSTTNDSNEAAKYKMAAMDANEEFSIASTLTNAGTPATGSFSISAVYGTGTTHTEARLGTCANNVPTHLGSINAPDIQVPETIIDGTITASRNLATATAAEWTFSLDNVNGTAIAEDDLMTIAQAGFDFTTWSVSGTKVKASTFVGSSGSAKFNLEAITDDFSFELKGTNPAGVSKHFFQMVVRN